MGMAASQGRLLALTARMHDIELRAQNLQSQKLALATQEDAAYQKYCDALDATKIQVGRTDATATGGIYYVDANFNSVMGYHSENLIQYSMINNMNGKVYVSPEIAEKYEEYEGDKYSFAWAMMGLEQFGWDGSDYFGSNSFSGAYVGINSPGYGQTGISYPGDTVGQSTEGNPYHIGTSTDGFMTDVEFLAFLRNVENKPALLEAYENLMDAYDPATGDPTKSISERRELLNEFRRVLYAECGDDIYQLMLLDTGGAGRPGVNDDIEALLNDPLSGYVLIPEAEDLPAHYDNSAFQRQFQYYTNLHDQITQAGGYEVIPSEYAGGAAGTEWFNNMVTSGLASLYVLRGDEWEATTIATSVGSNYLQEVNDEEKAKKAEVEYEHELKLINRKDTKFDLQLKKLETEENACKTELDSLKQVRDDNVERTFNLFS